MEIVFRAFRAFRDMWIHLIYVTRLSKFSNRLDCLGVSAIQQRFPKAMFFCANIAVAQHVSYCIWKCVTCCRIQAGQPMAHLNEHFRGLIGSSSHIETMRPHEGVTIKLLEMSILLQESALLLWCHLSWALQSYLQYYQLFVFLPDLPTCPTPAPPFTRTIHDYPICGPNYFSCIFPHFVGFPNSWGYHTQK